MSQKSVSKQALQQAVWDAVSSRQPNQVIVACEALNGSYPNDAAGWYTTSQAAMQLRNPQVALAAIGRALELEPTDSVWLLQKAACFAALGRLVELKETLAPLQSVSFKTAHQCTSIGSLLCQLGQHEAAVEHYQRAIELKPDDSQHHYNLACLYRSLGRIEEAEQYFNKTIALSPKDYEAYKIRSDLRKHKAERNNVAELETLLSQGIKDERGRVQVLYALAKEYEDIGEYARAFEHLSAGASLRRSYMRYDVENDLETMKAIQANYSADLFKSMKKQSACMSHEPIFILGMPRTGTTLVERILASHSKVESAGELTNFSVQMTQMSQIQNRGARPDRGAMVKRTTTLDFEQLGNRYIASTRPLTGTSPRFIDKLPLNYLYSGLIHLALPNAKIINLVRDPMDTCYSVYKQLFIDAYPFSYDLEELGRYFLAYKALMDHWHTVMPGVIYEVQYEQLVSDPEQSVRKLLSYCQLDFEPECMTFYNNRQASTTASAVQIRQPIYQSSVQNWRHYETQLQSLASLLGTKSVQA